MLISPIKSNFIYFLRISQSFLKSHWNWIQFTGEKKNIFIRQIREIKYVQLSFSSSHFCKKKVPQAAVSSLACSAPLALRYRWAQIAREPGRWGLDVRNGQPVRAVQNGQGKRPVRLNVNLWVCAVHIYVCAWDYALYIGTSEKETIHWNQLAAPPFWLIALKDFLCWLQPCSSCFSNNCVILNVCHDLRFTIINIFKMKYLIKCFCSGEKTVSRLQEQHKNTYTTYTDSLLLLTSLIK